MALSKEGSEAIGIHDIAAAVSATPGITGREIARILGCDKKIVNSLLYANTQVFISAAGEGSAPLWYPADWSLDVKPYVAITRVKDETKASDESAPTIRPPDEFDRIFDVSEFAPELLAKFEKQSTQPRVSQDPPAVTTENPFGLYRWQIEALAAWKANRSEGIIDAVTGAGKTRLAVAAIAEHLDNSGKVLVLVPTVVLLDQWVGILREQLPRFRIGRVGNGADDDLDYFDVVVAVLASARTRSFPLHGAAGLLVADECHRAGAKMSQLALDPAFASRLGLSATHERLDDAHETILLPYFNKVVFRLGYQRAIDDGVITNVRVAFVGVEFSEEEKQKYIVLQRQLSKLRRKLITVYGCRPQPFSAFLDDVIRLTTRGKREEGMVAQRWLKAWGDKKELLAETPAKTLALECLVPVLGDADRTLIFTQSITSAEAIATSLLAQNIAVAAHHSGIDTQERDVMMRKFASGELRVLASVQTLEEGVDVPDADLAIIVASSKQRRQMIQRMGRVMRRKSDGRDARFVILFANGTDEDPRLGAHESFVDELVEVARTSMITTTANLSELRAALDARSD